MIPRYKGINYHMQWKRNIVIKNCHEKLDKKLLEMRKTKISNKIADKKNQTLKHKDWGDKWGHHSLQDPANQMNPLAQVLSFTVYDAIVLQIINWNYNKMILVTYIQHPA